MKQPRILSLSKDQDNSTRNKKYFDKFSDIPTIKEEKEKILHLKKTLDKSIIIPKKTRKYTQERNLQRKPYIQSQK